MAETSTIFTDDSMELGRQFGVLEHYLKSTKAEKSVLTAYSFIAKRFNADEEMEPETEVEETEETNDTTEPADDDESEVGDTEIQNLPKATYDRIMGKLDTPATHVRTAARWTSEEDEYIKEKISQGVKPRGSALCSWRTWPAMSARWQRLRRALILFTPNRTIN